MLNDAAISRSTVPAAVAILFLLANLIILFNALNYRRVAHSSLDFIAGLKEEAQVVAMGRSPSVSSLRMLSGGHQLRPSDSDDNISSFQASQSARIWCQITFSAEYDQDLIMHSIQHYLDVGIDPKYMLITVHHTDPDATEELKTVVTTVRSFGIPHVQTWNGNFTSQKNCDMRYRHRKLAGVEDCDWVLKFDADELLRVPGNDIVAFLDVLGQQNFDSVFGIWVDRIADQGRIPNITADATLEEQFPLGCRFSESGDAKTTKVVAFRGYLKEKRAGHSLAKNAVTCRYPPMLLIDHYKWSWPVFRKLQRRIEHYRSIEGHDWWTESVAFLDRIAGNGGKINVTEPALQCIESINGPASNSTSASPVFDSFYMDNATEGACLRPMQCPTRLRPT
jgi:hypothetical protein